MRSLLLLLLISFFCSCNEQKQTDNSTELLNYQLDSLLAKYPKDWKITKQLQDADNAITSWQPIDENRSGLLTIAVSKSSIAEDMALRILKADMYESLGVDSLFQENEVEKVDYQGVKAIKQTYQATISRGKIEGQFIVLNKSGKCYIIYHQTKEKDKQINQQAFQIFEQHLEIH